jgi:DNA adenine methylase
MSNSPKPVLKWAGGKRQLLSVIDENLPSELKEGKIRTYWEPMIGAGAVFFHVKENYDAGIENYFISDYNWDLFILYKVIQTHVKELILELDSLSKVYLPLPPIKKGQKKGKRIKFYRDRRTEYNDKSEWDSVRYRKNGISPRKRFSKKWIRRAALTIFLNRTCFNGLYRINSSGEFNVPHGRYDKPQIVNEDNLTKVSKFLEGVNIDVGTYEDFLSKMDEDSFVYFDPPYRPLPNTNSFKDYLKADFGDAEQLKLAKQCHELEARGVKFLLSNSDPKNTDPNDDFFDKAYHPLNLIRIDANRNINSDGGNRGKISEILVRNYSVRGKVQQNLF